MATLATPNLGIRDENRRTGAGTIDNPLTDIQIQDLAEQGIAEGGYVPGKGVLTPTGVFTQNNVSMPAAPTTGLSSPAVADTLAGGTSSFSRGTYDPYPEYEDIYGKPVNERQIERDQMRLFQQEIDATNQVYDQLLNKARLEGQGRLGSQRAASARGGLLGSDFGMAQKEKVLGYNTDIERGIESERMAAIGAIMGNVRSAVRDEIANKNAARQQGAENYLNYLTSSRERRDKLLAQISNDLFSQGVDPTTLDPNELSAIAKEAGVSTQDIISSYARNKQEIEAAATEADQKSRKTEAEIKKIEADIAKGKLITLGEGTTLYDTETGDTFKNPKTYKGEGSTSVFSDKDLPGNIRNEILDDLQNSTKAKDGSLTVVDLLTAYPEVDTETLQNLYDSFYLPPDSDSPWWNFWD